MYDLSNHFPYGGPGFEEAGYTFKAWQPANDEARPEIVIQAFKDGELVKEVAVPMNHTNTFGLDVEDVFAMEEATDKLILELGGESKWPSQLDNPDQID